MHHWLRGALVMVVALQGGADDLGGIDDPGFDRPILVARLFAYAVLDVGPAVDAARDSDQLCGHAQVGRDHRRRGD